MQNSRLYSRRLRHTVGVMANEAEILKMKHYVRYHHEGRIVPIAQDSAGDLAERTIKFIIFLNQAISDGVSYKITLLTKNMMRFQANNQAAAGLARDPFSFFPPPFFSCASCFFSAFICAACTPGPCCTLLVISLHLLANPRALLLSALL